MIPYKVQSRSSYFYNNELFKLHEFFISSITHFTYVKQKALYYLRLAAPIAAASDNEGLNSAAKVVNYFGMTKFLWQ